MKSSKQGVLETPKIRLRFPKNCFVVLLANLTSKFSKIWEGVKPSDVRGPSFTKTELLGKLRQSKKEKQVLFKKNKTPADLAARVKTLKDGGHSNESSAPSRSTEMDEHIDYA